MKQVSGKTTGVGAQGLRVFRARDVTATSGANLGDAISHAADLILDDEYALAPDARAWPMALATVDDRAHLTVAAGAELGTPGAEVHLDCALTLMAPDGAIVEALVLVELEPGRELIAEIYLLPLAQLAKKTDYALVAVDTDGARARFAALACVSFMRGTRITLATGAQRRIEDIAVGDRVLTRDNGIQPVRWIGHQTVRATGAFAPVIIAAGAMMNAHALRLSPNQRIFVYQREDRLGAGQAEVVVKAEALVNGDDIVRGEGGFVDYYQILFDTQEFIFAEGIATESLTVDSRTSAALPRTLRRKLGLPPVAPGLRPAPIDVSDTMLDGAVAAEVLRAATRH